jgi:ribonuclease E
MRLRDLGGLIVVDFIDMEESKNRREVESRLRDALRQDRARVQFSSISKFGLLELSRQRLRPALSEGSHITCPRCNGTGHIRDTESSALQILRMVQEEAMKDNTAAVHVQVPVEVTSFLLNEKRTEITKIELKQRITVLLVPNKHLETPNYKLERLRHDDPRLENLQVSYSMIEEPDDEVGITRREKAKAKQEPVIKGILPDTAAPIAPPKPAPVAAAPAPAALPPVAPPPAPVSGGGFFSWVKKLFGAPEAVPTPVKPAAAPAAAEATNEQRREGRGERNGRGGRGRDGRRGERGDRNERGERGERGERAAGERGGERPEGRGDAAPRGERGEKGERSERGERGRGRRGERGERPEEVSADNAVRQERPAGDAPEARQDGRRQQPQRRPQPQPVEQAGDETAETRAFVDTVPGGDTPEAPNAEGQAERQGRRRRRGGRGRDRDEARGTETTEGAVGGDELQQSSLPLESGAETAEPLSADAEGAPASGEAGERGERDGRRRRGRGRDRQRRDENGEAAPLAEGSEGGEQQPAAEPFVAHEAATHADDVAPAAPSYVAEPVAAAPVAHPAPAAVAPAAAPAVPVAAAVVERFVLDTEQLQSVAEGAGLQWVNSDADKIRAAQEAMAREPKPVHVPREPRPVEAVDEGPLVLVETRKDLAQVRLPFETGGQQPSA